MAPRKPTPTPKPRQRKTARSTAAADRVTPPVSRPRSPSAFVASAKRIRLSDPSVSTQQRKPWEWQREAWNLYENVGEVGHAIDYIANHLSKVRLFGAMVPSDPRHPPETDTSPLAVDAVNGLKSSGGTYSGILREIAINLFVPGECFLVGKGGSTTDVIESWDVLSTDELNVTKDGYKVREYPGGPLTTYSDQDIIVIHIMLSHPRWGGLPLSPLHGVLASGEEVQSIERVIRAAARSRAAGPGLLLMPEEMSFGSMIPVEENSDTPQDPFMNALIDAMVTPIQDEGSASAVVPMLVRAPADVLKEIRHLSLAIDLDHELIKLDRALTRLAQGLPLPPEIVTGKQGLSHWAAFNIDEQTISAYIEPLAIPIVDALTSQYYRPFLEANGETDADARMMWFDVTPLITQFNRSADADFGLDHNAISDKAWRRIKGLAEEDAPTAVEKLMRLVLQRGSFDPIFTGVLMKELGLIPDSVTLPVNIINQPPTTKPGATSPADNPSLPPDAPTKQKNLPPTARGPGQKSSIIILPSANPNADDISLQLAGMDRDLRIRLQTSADAAVQRAMEKASATVLSKLRNHSTLGPVLRDVPKLQVVSRVGNSALRSEGIYLADLLAGLFDPFISTFNASVMRTYSKVSRMLSVAVDVPDRDIRTALAELESALVSFTIDRLNDGELTLASSGELDESTLIPQDIIRTALRRMGGSGPELLPSESSPPTGIATGPVVLNALRSVGWLQEGWEWMYSSTVRTRDFEPHANLDMVRFSSFSDPVLANRGTWPPVAFHYAGDHQTCNCSLRPLLIAPSLEAAN